MATWDTNYENAPSNDDDISLGAGQIRSVRTEVRDRGEVEHNWGTVTAGYTDDGRLLPGAARIYRVASGTALPTNLQKPDGSSQGVALGTSDAGRLCIDQNGWMDQVHEWTGTAWANTACSPNLVLNGGMRFDQRRAGTSATLTTATRTRVLDGWAVTITGASTGTVQQVTTGLPTGAVSKHGLKITGAASVTNVDLDHRFEARDCSQWGGWITVRLGWKYVDGASGTITPSFRVDTANAADNFSAVTNRATSAFTAGNDGFQTYSVDLSSLTNYANGVQLVVRFSGASDLNAATKSVTITDFSITPGRAAPRRFVQPDYLAEYDRCKRYYQKTFAYATVPAASAGLTNALTGAGNDVGGNSCAIGWQHGLMAGTGTLTTFNPSAAGTGAINDVGDTAALQASSVGTVNSHARFNTGPAGTSKTAFYVHMTLEAGL